MYNYKQIKIITSISSFIFFLLLFFLAYKANLFTSINELQNFLNKFGFFSFPLFILLQALQVIIPILPGGIGLLGGVVLFGSINGFLLNYIGICLGSIIAFLLAKNIDKKYLSQLFSKKLVDKYSSKMNDNFDKIFTIAIFLPIAPDDFLCYLAGTTKMKLKKFVSIILLGKPFAIFLYTYGLQIIMNNLIKIIK